MAHDHQVMSLPKPAPGSCSSCPVQQLASWLSVLSSSLPLLGPLQQSTSCHLPRIPTHSTHTRVGAIFLESTGLLGDKRSPSACEHLWAHSSSWHLRCAWLCTGLREHNRRETPAWSHSHGGHGLAEKGTPRWAVMIRCDESFSEASVDRPMGTHRGAPAQGTQGPLWEARDAGANT
jgi:hypothetical protein